MTYASKGDDRRFWSDGEIRFLSTTVIFHKNRFFYSLNG